jgi:soluble lytic murein transglycosylase-like protein
MIRRALLLAFSTAVLSAAATAPAARADYAVLKSGVRLHISGYELQGDRMVLTIPGGIVTVPALDIASIEPEDVFTKIEPPPEAIAAAADGKHPYQNFIHQAATKHGVDEKLIAHVIAAESNFNPKAVSRKSAMGLMQLLPKTAAQYSVGNIFDPAQNIEGGTHYLKDLLDRYRGDLKLALAAYNAGPDMVDRYGGVPPIVETQSYVRRITASLAEEKNRTR